MMTQPTPSIDIPDVAPPADDDDNDVTGSLEYELPTGSRAFESAMKDLIDTMPRMAVTQPLSPPVDGDSWDFPEHEDPIREEEEEPESAPPRVDFVEMVEARRRRTQSLTNVKRQRSVNGRVDHHHHQGLQLSSSQTSSPMMSPMPKRGILKKSNTQPNTPVMTLKYRFMTQNISVSHEDLARDEEQQRGHDDDDDVLDAGSIFHTPKLYRRFPPSSSSSHDSLNL